jgi:hypothetical protein
MSWYGNEGQKDLQLTNLISLPFPVGFSFRVASKVFPLLPDGGESYTFGRNRRGHEVRINNLDTRKKGLSSYISMSISEVRYKQQVLYVITKCAVTVISVHTPLELGI